MISSFPTFLHLDHLFVRKIMKIFMTQNALLCVYSRHYITLVPRLTTHTREPRNEANTIYKNGAIPYYSLASCIIL